MQFAFVFFFSVSQTGGFVSPEAGVVSNMAGDTVPAITGDTQIEEHSHGVLKVTAGGDIAADIATFSENLKIRKPAQGIVTWSAPPGEHPALVTIATREPFGIRTETVILRVSGNPTPPDPTPPGPSPPDPTPGPDDNLTGFAKEVRNLVQKLVPHSAREKSATLFSEVFSSLSSSVGAGAIRDFDSLVVATRNGLSSALTTESDRAPWRPFSAELALKIDELKATGKLSNKSQWIDIWKQISIGIEASKQ